MPAHDKHTAAPAIAPQPLPPPSERRPSRFVRKGDSIEVALAGLMESQRILLDRQVGLEHLHEQMRHVLGSARRRIMWSGTAQLNANGTWDRQFGDVAHALFVVNFATNGALTVVAAAPNAVAPGPGVGVHLVPAGTAMTFNAVTTHWTIYGTPGNVVDVQVFGVPMPPAAAGAM